MVLLGKDHQAAGNAAALQQFVHFEPLVYWHPEILLALRHQHGSREIGRVGGRALLPPRAFLFPDRAAVAGLPKIRVVGCAPKRSVIAQARVAHQALEAFGIPFEPVHQVSAIAGAGGGLPRAVDEGKRAHGLIGRLLDLRRRPAQDVFVNRHRELLPIAGRPGVVGHQQHIAGRRQQVIVPAQEERVLNHVVRAAVREHQQRILAGSVKRRRQYEQALNALAGLGSEPEFARRLPIDLRDPVFVELRQEAVGAASGIHLHHIGRMHHRLPKRHQNRRRGLDRNRQAGVAALAHTEGRPHRAAIRRQLEDAVVALVLCGHIDGVAVGSKGDGVHGTVPIASEQLRRSRLRPGDLHQAVEAIKRHGRAALARRIQGLAVGTEHRVGITLRARRERHRLAALRWDAVKFGGNRRGDRTVQIRGGEEHDAVPVRTPPGAQTRTAVIEFAFETRLRGQFGAG